MRTSKRAKIAALALCISLQSFYAAPAWATLGLEGDLAYEELKDNSILCQDPIPNSRLDKIEKEVYGTENPNSCTPSRIDTIENVNKK